MLTVINIDDEPLIKKTLRVLVDGYRGAFRVIGEAEDGREGLALIERHAPDLVITDLNMPVMTGLELIEAARTRGLSAEFAVLSGYDDFHFAQQALRWGVVDYVLKPIRPAAVSGLLDRVMLLRQGRASQLQQQQHGAEYADAAERAAWLALCSEASRALAEQIWLLDERGAMATIDRYADAVAASSARVRPAAGEPASMAAVLSRASSSMAAAQTHAAAWTAFSAMLTLVCAELDKRGVGALCPLLSAEWPLPEPQPGEAGEGMQRSMVAPTIAAPAFVAPTIAAPTIAAPASADPIFAAAAVAAAVRERVAQAIEALRSSRGVGDHQGIRRAAAYVDRHFRDCALTLAEVAEAAGMSPAHFSRTFKKEMGVTFIDYLTQKRIEHGKQLLAVPGNKTWEVAEAVGYQEYAHFAKVFKRCTGVTPSEYRKRQG